MYCARGSGATRTTACAGSGLNSGSSRSFSSSITCLAMLRDCRMNAFVLHALGVRADVGDDRLDVGQARGLDADQHPCLRNVDRTAWTTRQRSPLRPAPRVQRAIKSPLPPQLAEAFRGSLRSSAAGAGRRDRVRRLRSGASAARPGAPRVDAPAERIGRMHRPSEKPLADFKGVARAKRRSGLASTRTSLAVACRGA